MGINSRGSNAFMTKKLLKRSNIWAALHKGTQHTNDGMPVEEIEELMSEAGFIKQ